MDAAELTFRDASVDPVGDVVGSCPKKLRRVDLF
jgi:hypothetical protein